MVRETRTKAEATQFWSGKDINPVKNKIKSLIMHITYKILFFLSVQFFIQSCSNKGSDFKREKLEINKEFFFGKDQKIETNNLIKTMTSDVEKSFNLNPIYKSTNENEVRIYFANPFVERFFFQYFNSTDLTVGLYDCKTDRRNDSLFMHIFRLITIKGRYSKDSLVKIASLPNYSLQIDKNSPDTPVLDDGAIYFIQVKNGATIKEILINKPFQKEESNHDSKEISNFIRAIEKQYNFVFYDNWKSIDSLAFMNIK